MIDPQQFLFEYDDLEIVSEKRLPEKGEFTLVSVVKNEMFFLPSLIDHYTRLGVDRFVFLDDKSTDGSLEFLADHDNVSVLSSSRTFAETVNIPAGHGDGKIISVPMKYLWRNLLMTRYGFNAWILQIDADEFIRLPDGLTFPQLARQLDALDVEAVWGVMLDTYPASIVELGTGTDPIFDPDANWYFDGQPHVRLRGDDTPKIVYGGSISRLKRAYLSKNKPFIVRAADMLSRSHTEHSIVKPVLLKWGAKKFMRNIHRINFAGASDTLLPIVHYKFTSDLFRKIGYALDSKSYFNQSIAYANLQELLTAMKAEKKSFLYRKSLSTADFANFARTGNAMGL